MTSGQPLTTVSGGAFVEPALRMSPATRVLGLYTFLLFCRILEILPVYGLGELRLMLVVTAIALAMVFVTGSLVRALTTPLGIGLLAWTTWMVVCFPFSTWRSETLNQFVNDWLKSLAVFFIVAGLGSSAAGFKRLMPAMGWAAAAASLVVLPGLATATSENGVNNRLIGIGTLSNSNEIAFHLWLGMPFLLYLASKSTRLKRLFLYGVCCIELVLIVKTVSREGLLLALLAFIVAMFRVSLANKIKLAGVAAAVCLFAVMSLSPQALDRYLTLFGSQGGGVAARSAEASSQMRHQKLMESIELTLEHPIFGVGMGVFMPASVDVAKAKGGHVDWEVSHNSYTQVSSEIGLPGFLILLGIYITAWRQLSAFDRAAKRLDRSDVRQLVFTLRVALIILCIHFCFDSMAYLFYMPLITGVIAAFALAHQPMLVEQAEAALPKVVVEPMWNQPAAAQTMAPVMPKIEAKNPYRFGRRR